MDASGSGVVGLPFPGITDLDEIDRQSRLLESAATEGALSVPVPTCPGWTLADVLSHLAALHRVAAAWITRGRRRRSWNS
jgi:hypothetical protein